MRNHTNVYTIITLLLMHTMTCVPNITTPDNNSENVTLERLVPFQQTVTNAQSVGSTNAILIGKVDRTLAFKTLVAGSGVTLTPSSTELQISASPGPSITPSYAFVAENDTGALSVTANSSVLFNRSLVLTSDITYNTGTGNMTFANAGTYQITYTISMGAPASFQLFLDGTLVPNTKFMSSAGSADTKDCGRVIVAIGAGQVLSLRNTSGGDVLITPIVNALAFVRVSLIAQKIA